MLFFFSTRDKPLVLILPAPCSLGSATFERVYIHLNIMTYTYITYLYPWPLYDIQPYPTRVYLGTGNLFLHFLSLLLSLS